MQLYLPTLEIITDIHEIVLDLSGGKSGIHVLNDLHRAAARPETYMSFRETYDLDTVCAVIIDSIARYHGFNDGNKRTALMTALMTYRINKVHFKPTIAMNEQFDALVMWVVKKKPEIPEIESRLKALREKHEVAGEQPMPKLIRSFLKMRMRKRQAGD